MLFTTEEGLIISGQFFICKTINLFPVSSLPGLPEVLIITQQTCYRKHIDGIILSVFFF